MYDPQSAGIKMQSPQSDLTPWTLTLASLLTYRSTLKSGFIFTF